MKCFVSWSGGKDSCLALWRAKQRGLEVVYLLTTLSKSTGRTVGHGFSGHLMRAQAHALGLEALLIQAEWDEYESRFKEALVTLRKRGIEGGVFGDIDVSEHREWVEQVCKETEISPCLPLWGESQDILLEEWASQGFEAVVVSSKTDALGLEWLGRRVACGSVDELQRTLAAKGCSLSGEAGEYHTLAVWGPCFQKRIEIEEAVPVLVREHWMLDIRRFSLVTSSPQQIRGHP